jgi:endonuclease/exonuclease/phosphatase (EEP) superfamily protein YafD
MVITRIIAIILGIIIIAATLIPFLKKGHWWIRVFDFPRLQIFVIGMVCLALFFVAWQNKWQEYIFVFLVLSVLGYQLTKIFPYTPFAKKQVLSCKEPGNNPVFGILVMNVFMYNRNIEGALKIIFNSQPDILIAIETDHWWNNNLAVLKQEYPYYVLVPLENTYGMALYSKMRLFNPEIKYLYKDDVPSIHAEVQMKIGKRFKLYAVHPTPPAPGHSETSTHRDAELLTIGKETRKIEDPVIVAGDLNDVAWSFTTNHFQRYSELLDPRVGRGMFNTFNARSQLMRWPLDHIFHSDHFQLLDLKTLPYFGSDHFPIFIKLCYIPDKQHKQDEPVADGDDVKLASDKISRALSL